MGTQCEVAERADDERGQFILRSELQVGEIDFGLDRLRKRGLVGVIDHPYDRRRGVRPFLADLNLLTQRVLSPEVRVGEGLVDHRCSRGRRHCQRR